MCYSKGFHFLTKLCVDVYFNVSVLMVWYIQLHNCDNFYIIKYGYTTLESKFRFSVNQIVQIDVTLIIDYMFQP